MSSPFEKEDFADFRLNVIIKRTGHKALHAILIYAIPKYSVQTYYGYLVNDRKVTIRGNFDRIQKIKLRSDPSGYSFDITLLFHVITKGCESLAPHYDPIYKTPGELEYLLTQVKQARNDIAHSIEPIEYALLSGKVSEFKNILSDTLNEASKRLKIDLHIVSSKIQQLNEEIKKITESSLSWSDVNDYLLCEGALEIKSIYKIVTVIDPLEYISGINCKLSISDIYVDVEIRSLGLKEDKLINGANILNKFSTQEQVLIIEGIAGTGKSTFLKYIVNDWIEKDKKFVGLSDIPLLIYLQCSNCYIESCCEIFESAMPNTAKRFTNKAEFIKSLFEQNILILIDGVDEASASTRQIIAKLMSQLQGNLNVKVIFTTRPEQMKWLHIIIASSKASTLRLCGVTDNNRKRYVKILYENLVKHLSVQQPLSTNALLAIYDKVLNTIGNEMRLPLFLAMFTFICTVEPTRFETLSSSVTLYEELINILKDKLISRIVTRNPGLQIHSVTTTVDKFFEAFCKETMKTYDFEDDYDLTNESYSKLNDIIEVMGMSVQEALSSFMVMKVVITPRGTTEKLTFPHKGLHDYITARAMSHNMITGSHGLRKTIVNFIINSELFTNDSNVLVKNNDRDDKLSGIDNLSIIDYLCIFCCRCCYGGLKIPMTVEFAPNDIKSFTEDLPQPTPPLPPPIPDKSSDPAPFFPYISVSQSHDMINLPDINPMQNIIYILSGILANNDELSDDNVAEVIQLYVKANITYSIQWLDLLQNVKYHTLVCKHILKEYRSLTIYDNHLKCLFAILKHGHPRELKIVLKTDHFDDLILKETLQMFQLTTKCNLSLEFLQAFKNSNSNTVDKYINILKDVGCMIQTIAGHLSLDGLNSLPGRIMALRLCIGSQQEVAILHNLERFLNLQWLSIHVCKDVEICGPLTSNNPNTYLYMSKVSDSENDANWAIKIAKSLQTQIRCLYLPESSIGIQLFSKIFAQLCLTVERFYVASEQINDEDLEDCFYSTPYTQRIKLRRNDEIW